MSKYKAEKITVDGYRFDSKVEAKYYEKLKEDKAKGLVQNFELQPEFVLIPKFSAFKKNYRETKYIGDFLIYHNNGTQEVIDVKGWATETAKLKRKIFMWRFGDEIELTWLKWYKGEWVKC